MLDTNTYFSGPLRNLLTYTPFHLPLVAEFPAIWYQSNWMLCGTELQDPQWAGLGWYALIVETLQFGSLH